MATHGDRYLDKTNPDHPCYTGCDRIWMEGRKSWVCIRCDSEDRARPAPLNVSTPTYVPYPMPTLDLPPLRLTPPETPLPEVPQFPRPSIGRPEWTPGGWPGKPSDVVISFGTGCCMCTAPLAPGQTSRVLGINCQCQCHGRAVC